MPIYRIDNRPAAINWSATEETERTIQNAKNLLMTRWGDVPYDRGRGLNPALFDMPLGDALKILRVEVEGALMQEPDAELVAVRGYMEDGFGLIIEADINVEVEEDAG